MGVHDMKELCRGAELGAGRGRQQRQDRQQG